MKPPVFSNRAPSALTVCKWVFWTSCVFVVLHRVLFVLVFNSLNLQLDSMTYIRWALAAYEPGPFWRVPMERPPLYPLFLWGLFRGTGSMMSVAWVQHLLNLVVVVALGVALSREVRGSAAGQLASAFFVLAAGTMSVQVVTASAVMSDNLHITLLGAMVLFAHRAEAGSGWAMPALLLAVAGAALNRMVAVFAVVPVVFMLFYLWLRAPKKGAARFGAQLLALVAVWFVMFKPGDARQTNWTALYLHGGWGQIVDYGSPYRRDAKDALWQHVGRDYAAYWDKWKRGERLTGIGDLCGGFDDRFHEGVRAVGRRLNAPDAEAYGLYVDLVKEGVLRRPFLAARVLAENLMHQADSIAGNGGFLFDGWVLKNVPDELVLGSVARLAHLPVWHCEEGPSCLRKWRKEFVSRFFRPLSLAVDDSIFLSAILTLGTLLAPVGLFTRRRVVIAFCWLLILSGMAANSLNNLDVRFMYPLQIPVLFASLLALFAAAEAGAAHVSRRRGTAGVGGTDDGPPHA